MNLISIVKKRTVAALVSDDIFMAILVLKGGNALDLAYDISNRGSLDIDFSIEGDFSDKEKKRMCNQAKYLLNSEFSKEKLTVFDINFQEKPNKIAESVKDFWGGYKLEFKLIETEKYNKYFPDIEKIRRESLSIGKKGKQRYVVDISKYEYIGHSKKMDIEGAVVQVYSPEMLCIEKLRAICQQTEEYKAIIETMKIRARARDFYDIVNMVETFKLNFNTRENIELAKLIFDVKKVPLSFISLLPQYKEFHSNDWENVLQTIDQTIKPQPYDYYFDFVNSAFKHLCN